MNPPRAATLYNISSQSTGWHVHFTRHSPVRGSLVCQPVHCGKRFSISVLVSTSLCEHRLGLRSSRDWQKPVCEPVCQDKRRKVPVELVRRLLQPRLSCDWGDDGLFGKGMLQTKTTHFNTVWIKNGQHVWVQNNKGGKPQTNTNSNRILWKKFKSKELSHLLAEVLALIVCLFLLFSVRFILE